MTLNRPQVRNAIDRPLAEVLTRLDAEPVLTVGLLTGTGGHFGAGTDLKAFPAEGVPVVAGCGLAVLEQGAERPASVRGSWVPR